MLPAEAKALVITQILPPVVAADTAGATTGWVAVPVTEGCLVFIQEVGALGGASTLAGALETATSNAGAGAVALLPDDGTAGFTAVAAADKVEAKSFNARKNLGYVRYTGTIAVSTVAVSVCVIGRPKTTT